jgi:hypothetical protein
MSIARSSSDCGALELCCFSSSHARAIAPSRKTSISIRLESSRIWICLHRPYATSSSATNATAPSLNESRNARPRVVISSPDA